MYGLTDSDLAEITKIISQYPEIKEALIFGSRAKGNYKKGSDIDIALKGENLAQIALEVKGLLDEESPLPYFFDVVDYAELSNSDLREHIDRVGKLLYRKGQT